MTLCPKCGENKHTVQYWFTSCPGLSSTYMELIGSVDVPLNLLSLTRSASVAESLQYLLGQWKDWGQVLI